MCGVSTVLVLGQIPPSHVDEGDGCRPARVGQRERVRAELDHDVGGKREVVLVVTEVGELTSCRQPGVACDRAQHPTRDLTTVVVRDRSTPRDDTTVRSRPEDVDDDALLARAWARVSLG